MNIVEQIINFADQQIYIKRWSVGLSQQAPIILLHESLGSVELWKTFPEKLAAMTQRDVIAYDRLGFGKSSPLTQLNLNFVIDEASSTFQQVVQHFQLEQFLVMGHSVGGGMAAVCAGIYPEQCRAVITASAQTEVEDVTLTGILKAKNNFNNEKFIGRLTKFHGNKAQWVLNAWTDTWLSPAFVDWNINDQIRQIHCPMLVIHGEQDEYATLAQPQRFVDLASGKTELQILKDCGHFPHQEKETEVLNLIQNFVKDI